MEVTCFWDEFPIEEEVTQPMADEELDNCQNVQISVCQVFQDINRVNGTTVAIGLGVAARGQDPNLILTYRMAAKLAGLI